MDAFLSEMTHLIQLSRPNYSKIKISELDEKFRSLTKEEPVLIWGLKMSIRLGHKKLVDELLRLNKGLTL